MLHNDVKKRPPKNTENTSDDKNGIISNSDFGPEQPQQEDEKQEAIDQMVECPMPYNPADVGPPPIILSQSVSHLMGHGGIPLHTPSHGGGMMGHYERIGSGLSDPTTFHIMGLSPSTNNHQ